MTVGSTTNRSDYTGSGSTDTYAYGFRIFSEEDLLVTKRLISTGEETTLVLTTDYTVTGVSDLSGGTIVLIAGNLASTYHLTIQRVRTLLQETDLRNQGNYLPEDVEDEFDRGVMIAQQQQDAIDRSVKLPPSILSSDFDTNLPADLVGQSNVVFGTNAAGDGFEAGPTFDQIENIGTSAANIPFRTVVTKTFADSPITLTEDQRGTLFIIDTIGGTVQINLPLIGGLDLSSAFVYGFKKLDIDGSTNNVFLVPSGSDSIDLSATKSFKIPGGMVSLVPTTTPTPDMWVSIDGIPISGDFGATSISTSSYVDAGSFRPTDSVVPPFGIYSPNLNDVGFATNTTYAGSIDTSQQWTFGSSNASARTHNFFKDVNAGDTTTALTLKIGNSGSNQGVGNLIYTNAAATGAPQFQINHSPRNNADSAAVTVARIQFLKSAASDSGTMNIGTSNAGTIANAIQISATQTLVLGSTASTNHTLAGNLLTMTSNASNDAELRITAATLQRSIFTGTGRANAVQNQVDYNANFNDGSTNRRIGVLRFNNTSTTSSSSGGQAEIHTSTTGGTLTKAFAIDETQNASVSVGNLLISTVGKGLQIKEGSNARMGTGTLSAGTAVISTTAVTATSRIFLTTQSLGTVTLGQGLAVSARSVGTSFTVTSGSAIDTSTFGWLMVEGI